MAQLSDGAGPGAWMNGAVLCICFFIILASLKNGFKDISLSDKAIFCGGVFSIFLWIGTGDALWSVVLVSVANTLAYIPTFRKSFHKPQEEAVYLFGINFFRHGVSTLALANFSFITALFPIVLAFNNGALALFILWRRRSLKTFSN